MNVATTTTPVEDIQDQKLCESNTEGDDGQRSETKTVPLDSAPVSSHTYYENDAIGSTY
jgi:hypothetical protein